MDVPLGGDRSPVEFTGDRETGLTAAWSPRFRGGLLYPFRSPDPISIPHSLAGDDIPLADMTLKDGGLVTDSAGRDNLNGYLGSFVADTTIALCVAEQERTADQLRADPGSAETLKTESSELIRRSAAPDAS